MSERNGLIALGHKLVNGLGPQFLMLLLINTAFLGVLFWYLDKREEVRERLITPIIADCMRLEHQQGLK